MAYSKEVLLRFRELQDEGLTLEQAIRDAGLTPTSSLNPADFGLRHEHGSFCDRCGALIQFMEWVDGGAEFWPCGHAGRSSFDWYWADTEGNWLR